MALPAFAWAQRCGDGRPRPAWISQPESSDDTHYYSANVSDASASSQAARMASARQNASIALAQIIQVQVANRLTTEVSRTSATGKATLTASQMKSVSESSTQATVQGLEVVESWDDPSSCAMWVRARLPRQFVEQKQRELVARPMVEVLKERLSVAGDAGAPLERREEALSGGTSLVERIDFSLVPEAGSSLYYQQQLASIRNNLRQAGGESEAARQVLRAVDQALQKAISGPESSREVSYSEAAKQLKLLAARHPNGVPGVITAQALQFRVGEVEEMRGNSCGARLAYGRIPADTPQGGAAKGRAANLKCSAADMEKEYWRAYIAGRPVQLHCYVVQGGTAKPWPKMCDSVVSHLGGIGTAATANAVRVPPEDLKRLLNEGGAPPRASAEELPMVFLAQGEFKRRKDPDGGAGGGFEYQFEGTVGAVVFEGDKPAFTDRFQGITGWNPISEKMVEDVLGLNVFRRWKDKFGQFVQK